MINDNSPSIMTATAYTCNLTWPCFIWLALHAFRQRYSLRQGETYYSLKQVDGVGLMVDNICFKQYRQLSPQNYSITSHD